MDNAGETREYGPTSMFKHLPTNEDSPDASILSGVSPLSINCAFLEGSSIWNLPEGFDGKMHQDTLQVFFAFFNPWCWWVDEDRFRHDMTMSPAPTIPAIKRTLRTAYYSPLLHFAILAVGVMYLDYLNYSDREALANQFARNAATFFEDEIEAAKLSAVSGLMLLGSHHAGHARQGLGYIYAGIGMRLTRIRECPSIFILRL